ncbi:hypothetical protein LMG28614_02106 [Paraburkholderia ultramafica]|uniref:CHAD domain-containing protein n=1 Tax=Paraburkholderia ultramafica TaxID=1544867 RepID=A0A6S7B213_9BURK|nr:hypothetical protein LMG28614_02106 [Paraburkholderia ultramafica]
MQGDAHRDGIGGALADALNRAERITALSSRVPVTQHIFDRDGALAAHGWRVTIEVVPGIRRIVASRRTDHVLGVAIRDAVCNAPLAAGSELAQCAALLHDFAETRVRKHFKRLIGAPALTSLDAAARHRQRIEVKRLRYALEFFEPITSEKTRRTVAKTLVRIQGALGDGSDAATALRFFERLDLTPYQQGFARGWCEAVNRCTAQEGERLLRTLGTPKIKREA